jgi:hypothetical protein
MPSLTARKAATEALRRHARESLLRKQDAPTPPKLFAVPPAGPPIVAPEPTPPPPPSGVTPLSDQPNPAGTPALVDMADSHDPRWLSMDPGGQCSITTPSASTRPLQAHEAVARVADGHDPPWQPLGRARPRL